MNSKPTNASAANVIVPAYLALQQKGYHVWCEGSADVSGEDTWYAENSCCRFVAEDPVTLLGLVAMYETRGDDWTASDQQIDEFLSEY